MRKLAASHTETLSRGSTIISATNGKTTTAAMVAAILERSGTQLVHNRAGANMANQMVNSEPGTSLMRPSFQSSRIAFSSFTVPFSPTNALVAIDQSRLTPSSWEDEVRKEFRHVQSTWDTLADAGVRADRTNRKQMLGFGLILNALAIGLRKGLADLDVPLWYDTELTELLLEDDRVVGARLLRDGREQVVERPGATVAETLKGLHCMAFAILMLKRVMTLIL